MAAQNVTNNHPDGFTFGQSATDKVAFYGATPVAQLGKPVAAVTTATTTSTPYGFATQAQGDAIVTAVNLIITRLTTLGLWA